MQVSSAKVGFCYFRENILSPNNIVFLDKKCYIDNS